MLITCAILESGKGGDEDANNVRRNEKSEGDDATGRKGNIAMQFKKEEAGNIVI